MPFVFQGHRETDMGQDVDAAREALGSVPPAKPAQKPGATPPEGGIGGPLSPGRPEPGTGQGPESGGYDDRPPLRGPDNAKGGHGAG